MIKTEDMGSAVVPKDLAWLETYARLMVETHLRRHLTWNTIEDAVSGHGLNGGQISEIRKRARELMDELADEMRTRWTPS